MALLQCGRKSVSSPPFVPESGSQLYHALLDRCAGRGAKVRVRSGFVTQSSERGATTMCARKTRAGTPSVPARACTPCVPPLREARSQSFMKWRSSRICAPAPTREGRCSFAWWPQKYSWPPEGIVARTQARAPQASQRFAAFSCGSSSTGRSRVCAFMLPSHTITPRRAPLFTRGAITRPTIDTSERGRGTASNHSPRPPRKRAH